MIAVQTGDNDTGISESNPSNRAAKGLNTEQAIWTNQKQFSLFDAFPDTSSVDSNENQ